MKDSDSVEINPVDLVDQISLMVDEKIQKAQGQKPHSLKNGRILQVVALSLAVLAGGSGGVVAIKSSSTDHEVRFAALERTDAVRAPLIIEFAEWKRDVGQLAKDVDDNRAWIDAWPEGGELQVDRRQNERLSHLEETMELIADQIRLGGRFTREHGLGLFDVLIHAEGLVLSSEDRAQLIRIRDELRHVSAMP